MHNDATGRILQASDPTRGRSDIEQYLEDLWGENDLWKQAMAAAVERMPDPVVQCNESPEALLATDWLRCLILLGAEQPRGIHRVVFYSPFDSERRRYTTFVSVGGEMNGHAVRSHFFNRDGVTYEYKDHPAGWIRQIDEEGESSADD